MDERLPRRVFERAAAVHILFDEVGDDFGVGFGDGLQWLIVGSFYAAGAGALLAVPLLIIVKTVLDAAGKPDIAGFLFEEGTLIHDPHEEPLRKRE